MLLSESVKALLVDSLHESAYVINGANFTTKSMRISEEKRREEWDNFIAVSFEGDSSGRRYIGDIIGVMDNGFHIFGHESICEVVITVSAKERVVNGKDINPRFFTEAIMKSVISNVRMQWNKILASNGGGAIDIRKGHVEKDLTSFLKQQMRSERFYRFYIRYQDAWTLKSEDDEGLPTKGFEFEVGMGNDYTYQLVMEE